MSQLTEEVGQALNSTKNGLLFVCFCFVLLFLFCFVFCLFVLFVVVVVFWPKLKIMVNTFNEAFASEELTYT